MKNLKQEIESKTRKLQATWIVDMVDMVEQHGLDVEEELARILQDEIAAEFVNEAIRNDCMLKGWTEAPFKLDHVQKDYIEVSTWLKANVSGRHQVFGNEIWFESKKDLTAFLARIGHFELPRCLKVPMSHLWLMAHLCS